MGHKEKTIEELIAAADERIRTLRGLQRDIDQSTRRLNEAREWFDRTAESVVEEVTNKRLHQMYALIEDTEAQAIEVVAERLTQAFDILFEQAFRTRDMEEVKAGIRVIRAVTETLNQRGWEPSVDVMSHLVHSTVEGLSGVQQARHDGTRRTVGETLRHRLGTPHASVQDVPGHVG